MPELVVENPLDERVLLYDGEELVGAKQNRILNVSVLVEAKSALTIPVSCVEQGRWSHVSRRRSMPAGTSRTRSSAGARPRRRLRGRSRAASRRARCGTSCASKSSHVRRLPTGASSDLYRAHERDIRALEDAFPPSRVSAARSSARATTCAWTSSLDRTPSRGCGRSSVPATCSTRSSASTESRRPFDGSSRLLSDG